MKNNKLRLKVELVKTIIVALKTKSFCYNCDNYYRIDGVFFCKNSNFNLLTLVFYAKV